jgi:lipoyl(octanoyl) transferase
MSNKKTIFENLETISFKKAWDYQEQLFQHIQDVKSGKETNKQQYLLFCEHPHVYTLGKSGSEENLLISEKFREEKQIEYFHINRGGDITYHGPGQLVGYPIIDLEEFDMGIKSYIYHLEEVIIETLKEYGISASRLEGAIGVWLDVDNPAKARKICAIGVKTSRFVTMHGFAFNINTNLDYFGYINPCGFTDKGVTSLEKELGQKMPFEEVSAKVKKNFAKVFGMEFVNG